MDDQEFRWRVMGACIQHAAGYKSMSDDGADRRYALRVLSQPHVVDQMMLCIVASNPQIAALITVGADGTVDTTGVPDNDIEFVVAQAWADVAEQIQGGLPSESAGTAPSSARAADAKNLG
ncbi:hypothetical protein [Brevibacterium luteolum]|nr:hypothetical protein [Brevibacterium luteolum]